MKKIYLLVLLCMSFVGIINANAEIDEIKKIIAIADTAYVHENYDIAIENYEKIVKNNYESLHVYFNMGNSYFKKGDIARAILNFERAKLLAPNDEDIQFNLNIAKTQTVDKIEVLPDFFLVSWYKNYYNLMSYKTWGFFSLLSFVLGLTFLGLYFFAKEKALKKGYFLAAGFVFIISLASYLPSRSQLNQIRNHNSAIVTALSVTVKSAPDESGTDIFPLHEGAKVFIIDELNDWQKIKLTDGKVGWLKANNIERI